MSPPFCCPTACATHYSTSRCRQLANCSRAAALVLLPPQVRDFYATYLAPGSPTRRKLSLHIVGRAHAAELQAAAPSGAQMVELPQDLGKKLPFWPPLLGDPHAC